MNKPFGFTHGDEAIQNYAEVRSLLLDFVAEPVIGPANSGRTRWLAMTNGCPAK
jgi:hypothetical protein